MSQHRKVTLEGGVEEGLRWGGGRGSMHAIIVSFIK